MNTHGFMREGIGRRRALLLLFMLMPAAQALLDGAAGPRVLAAEERRPPPQARSAGTLGQQVSRRVFEVIDLLEMEQYDEALELLEDIRGLHERDRLNAFETYTMWQFYANLESRRENYPRALDYYRSMVAVPGLPDDRMEPGWYSIAVLNQQLENFSAAVDAYYRYLEIAESPGPEVYLRVAAAHYQLEQYQQALPHVLRHMRMQRERGTAIPQSTWSLLRSLYFSLDDFQSFRAVTRDMVALFNAPQDWVYLANANSQLERFDQHARVLYVAGMAEHLDSGSEYQQLAFAMSNSGDPYGAARQLQRAMERGIVEENEDNLTYLSQFYQQAREDAMALAPMEKVANMTEDPDLFVRLAGLYMNLSRFEEAARAYNRAFQAGEPRRQDQVLLQLARAYWELNQHDEAIAAARQAATWEASREIAQGYVSSLEQDRERYQALQRNRKLYEDYFSPRPR